jgi:hypothetical protein
MFKIPDSNFSPLGWRSVSAILNEGVGMSTLPCTKLRAILDAAKEIIHVFEEQHRSTSGEKEAPEEQVTYEKSETDVQETTLGADDFLPILIYCVVQAEMERPCALCKDLNANKHYFRLPTPHISLRCSLADIMRQV